MFENLAIVCCGSGCTFVGWRRLEGTGTADDVVGDDERSWMAQVDGSVEVLRIVAFVGVDKDQVKGGIGNEGG